MKISKSRKTTSKEKSLAEIDRLSLEILGYAKAKEIDKRNIRKFLVHQKLLFERVLKGLKMEEKPTKLLFYSDGYRQSYERVVKEQNKKIDEEIKKLWPKGRKKKK